MTIDEAINIACGLDKCRGTRYPTIPEAIECIDEKLATCGFNWLTGQEARRVLAEASKNTASTPQGKSMNKSTLTLDVEYDEDVTDPESLASAADMLLKTALSTPEILGDYGNPRFGEFFVQAPSESKPTVIVEVSGGVLQEAYSGSPVRLVLIDWDAEGCEPSAESSIYEADGKLAYVVEMPVAAIDTIVGTVTGMALEAAGMDVLSGQESNLEESRRWVLYNFDLNALLTTKVYSDYDEAVEDAAQANDVLVLPLVILSIVL